MSLETTRAVLMVSFDWQEVVGETWLFRRQAQTPRIQTTFSILLIGNIGNGQWHSFTEFYLTIKVGYSCPWRWEIQNAQFWSNIGIVWEWDRICHHKRFQSRRGLPSGWRDGQIQTSNDILGELVQCYSCLGWSKEAWWSKEMCIIKKCLVLLDKLLPEIPNTIVRFHRWSILTNSKHNNH